MKNLEEIKLYNDLNSISLKYKNMSFDLEENDIYINTKLQTNLIHYKNNIDDIKSRANLISSECRKLANNSNTSEIINTIIELNSFAKEKFDLVLNNKIKESLPIETIINITLEELILINTSISNKDFLQDKFTYFYIYEKVAINSFLTFLAIRDLEVNKEKIEALSQGILSQIQCLSLISM